MDSVKHGHQPVQVLQNTQRETEQTTKSSAGQKISFQNIYILETAQSQSIVKVRIPAHTRLLLFVGCLMSCSQFYEGKHEVQGPTIPNLTEQSHQQHHSFQCCHVLKISFCPLSFFFFPFQLIQLSILQKPFPAPKVKDTLYRKTNCD